TVVTDSAFLDERFRRLKSVRAGHIGAVLCVPVDDGLPRGVLYLQNCARGPRFSEDDRTRAETFAWHLAPLVDRVLARHRARTVADHTAAVRMTLRAGHGVGRSGALAAVLRQVAQVAPLDVHVLLTAETATAKSQLARVIHDNGPPAGHPFPAL